MAPNSNARVSAPAMATDSFSDERPEVVGQEDDIFSVVSQEMWHTVPLSIVVLGASGDLAKKKIYPSLLSLRRAGLLPAHTAVVGFGRSPLSDEDLRARLRPHLPDGEDDDAAEFLSACTYARGSSYEDADAFGGVSEALAREGYVNRMFYLAIPPERFGGAARCLRGNCMSSVGWNRLVVEKPFGTDTATCAVLEGELRDAGWMERDIYRIDHYLGKEMVQNILPFRIHNPFFQYLWNGQAIESVTITCKENFGTDGRGGYFDSSGIIRDIIQNHLLQMLCFVAMELPGSLSDPHGKGSDIIRDAKVNVLKAIQPVRVQDCVLGQYVGYTDDPTVPDDSVTPTYAAVTMNVDTPRWAGVPFTLIAGKALEERSAEIRLRFRSPDASPADPSPSKRRPRAGRPPPNELVLRLQPTESISLTTSVKSPGFGEVAVPATMRLDYETAFEEGGVAARPDAYARLLLGALRARRDGFVRSDELMWAWRIFTPLLQELERTKVRPLRYERGSKGPLEGGAVIRSEL